jgi:hypothetical protein
MKFNFLIAVNLRGKRLINNPTANRQKLLAKLAEPTGLGSPCPSTE